MHLDGDVSRFEAHPWCVLCPVFSIFSISPYMLLSDIWWPRGPMADRHVIIVGNWLSYRNFLLRFCFGNSRIDLISINSTLRRTQWISTIALDTSTSADWNHHWINVANIWQIIWISFLQYRLFTNCSIRSVVNLLTFKRSKKSLYLPLQ